MIVGFYLTYDVDTNDAKQEFSAYWPALIYCLEKMREKKRENNFSFWDDLV